MTIVENLTLMLQAQEEVPVPTQVYWDSESPLELLLSFHIGLPEPVQWLFSRDLFGEAINNPGIVMGPADVQIVLIDGKFLIDLSSPFGQASFTAGAEIEQFIRRTYEQVPTGESESDLLLKDLDAVLADLLRKA